MARMQQNPSTPSGGATTVKTIPTPAPSSSLGFQPLSELKETANVLYYGREGAGKTTAAAGLANLGRVLFVNSESGIKSRPLAALGVATENIMVYPPKGKRLTFKALQEAYLMVAADLANDPESWAGVVFDSATDISSTILDEVSSERVTRLRNQGREVDEWFVDLADYGGLNKRFRHLLRRFRDLPCHFVVTALERRDVDEDSGSVQYGPAATPGVATDLLGYVDFVIHTKQEDENGPFRGATKKRGKYRAKDRFGVLPPVMVNPSADRVVAYMNGDLTAATDPAQTVLEPTTKTSTSNSSKED